MSLLNYKMSLYHELKTVILPDFGYIEHIENEELTLMEENMYQVKNREIAYADPSGRINPSGFRITDAGRLMGIDEYSLDYINGIVTFSTTPSGNLTASYSFYPVKVIDAFPIAEEFETYELPVISLDIDSQTPSNYAIGQNESYWIVDYFIDIFASTDVMRLQMMDRIQRSLKKWLPLIDFEKNMPLNYDGTINLNFSWEEQFVKWMKIRGNPKGTLLNLGNVSIKERFRANIHGQLKTVH